MLKKVAVSIAAVLMAAGIAMGLVASGGASAKTLSRTETPAPVTVYSVTVYGGCPALESVLKQYNDGTLTLGGERVAVIEVQSTNFTGCFVPITLPAAKR